MKSAANEHTSISNVEMVQRGSVGREGGAKLMERTMVYSPAVKCAISDAQMGMGGDDASTWPVVQALADVRRYS